MSTRDDGVQKRWAFLLPPAHQNGRGSRMVNNAPAEAKSTSHVPKSRKVPLKLIEHCFSLTTFSPSGKLVQIDHALAAVGQGTTSLGIKASNGIVIATSKKTPSPLVDDSMLEKVAMICPNIGVVYSGMGPDYRVLVAKARKLAQAYWKIYGEYPSTRVMVGEIANVMQEATHGVRPFGVSLLVAGFDKTKGHTLYQVDPSGAFWAWKASAIGKNQVNARTFLEKRYNDDLSLEDAIHTALLTLKEGFEGVMTEKTIEIGVISTAGYEILAHGGHGTGKGDSPVFRKLTESEVADYLQL
ncbi:Proteasome subunit alpha type-2 [Microbotryomycetes sp. JL201]|nr:Proteasome subunit alpha type-2 [Microbotryomycetes sp. JL201]